MQGPDCRVTRIRSRKLSSANIVESRASTGLPANFRVEHHCFNEFERDTDRLAARVSNGFLADNAPNTRRRAGGLNLAWPAAWL